MVDQPEYGTNQTHYRAYLTDFIKLQLNPKHFDTLEIVRLFTENGLSAAQIATEHGVVKSVILGILHRSGVRLGTRVGRSVDPQNYRNNSPPYGYCVKKGRLMPDKAELKICRAVVELRGRQCLSTTAVARELERRGYKNRGGRTVWNPTTVLNIFNRWKDKL